jgi:mannose-1-phosphate guanylyltransferase
MRLRSFILRLKGKALPKQYVNFIGSRSMLEHTFHRAEKMIPADRLFTVISRDHFGHSEVRRQLATRPRGTVVLQPENKETGPGLLLPLMHAYKQHPDAVVVIFPSDHFIVEEDLFMGHVELACRQVERDSGRVVLLGIEPDGPESEYGYILPVERQPPKIPIPAHKVSHFIEKPHPSAARELIGKGGVWNTMVMVFKAKTLIDLVRRAAPKLHQAFHRIWQAIGTSKETAVIKEVYRKLESINFSKELLEIFPSQDPSSLWVLPVRGVLWSDWGSEQRIMSILEKTGHLGRLLTVQNDTPLQRGPVRASLGAV